MTNHEALAPTKIVVTAALKNSLEYTASHTVGSGGIYRCADCGIFAICTEVVNIDEDREEPTPKDVVCLDCNLERNIDDQDGRKVE